MNQERIRELALEAGYLPDGFGIGHWDMEECRNLVELVVRECIEQGNVLAKHYIASHPEQEQAMLLASIADYSNAIEQHFGVCDI